MRIIFETVLVLLPKNYQN